MANNNLENSHTIRELSRGEQRKGQELAEPAIQFSVPDAKLDSQTGDCQAPFLRVSASLQIGSTAPPCLCHQCTRILLFAKPVANSCKCILPKFRQGKEILERTLPSLGRPATSDAVQTHDENAILKTVSMLSLSRDVARTSGQRAAQFWTFHVICAQFGTTFDHKFSQRKAGLNV